MEIIVYDGEFLIINRKYLIYESDIRLLLYHNLF